MAVRPVLLVHGGAGAWPLELAVDCSRGIRAALAAGWAVLDRGGSALDAAEAAVVSMEDDETFNAGRGSCLTSDGRVQMDALIVDGRTLEAGGVALTERLRNPIQAARLVLDHSPHVLLAGPEAEAFAVAHGQPLCSNEELITDRRRDTSAASRPLPADIGDTVGAVALDAAGNLAAATSTGGVAGKAPGRIGDSPLPGAGCAADNPAGAVSATGSGEHIMRLSLGAWALDRLRAGVPPQRAAELAISYLERRAGGSGGLILLDGEGRYGAARNTAAMPWGVRTSAGELVQELKGELA